MIPTDSLQQRDWDATAGPCLLSTLTVDELGYEGYDRG